MKLKYLTMATVVSATVFSTSCSEWLDVNHNPNYPETVPSELLLPGIEVGAAYTSMDWDYMFLAGIYNQYFTQNSNASQFKTCEQFYLEDFSYSYLNIYDEELNEAKTLMASKSEDSGYQAIAELMSIYLWQLAVDTWGDIPYSEALNPENIAPKFDNEKDIYKDLLSRINKVVDNFKNNVYQDDVASNMDFLLGGDLQQWSLFANSLKLRILMRLLNTDLSSYADVKTFVENTEFLSSSVMVKESTWEDKTTKQYPLDEYENGKMSSTNIVASSTITNYMENDSRLFKVFSPINGEIVGKNQGSYDYNTTNSQLSPAVKNIPLISTWEIYFNISEVYLMSGDNDKALEYYKMAIDESFAYWGLYNSEAEVYGSTGYAQFTGHRDNDFKTLCLQRWASSLMTQHAEGMFSRLRSGYPEYADEFIDNDELTTNFPVGNLVYPICGQVTLSTPASIGYPNESVLALNVNSPSQKKDCTVKLFWQK